MEVLLASRIWSADGLWARSSEFEGKWLGRFKDVARGDHKAGGARGRRRRARVEAERKESKGLLKRFKDALGDRVLEVRVSERLRDSPACLVRGEGELSAPMRRVLAAAGQSIPASQPVFELNVTHPLVRYLENQGHQVFRSQLVLRRGQPRGGRPGGKSGRFQPPIEPVAGTFGAGAALSGTMGLALIFPGTEEAHGAAVSAKRQVHSTTRIRACTPACCGQELFEAGGPRLPQRQAALTGAPARLSGRSRWRGPRGVLEALLGEAATRTRRRRDLPWFAIPIRCTAAPFTTRSCTRWRARVLGARPADVALQLSRWRRGSGSYDEGRGEVDDALAVIDYGTQRWPLACPYLAGFSFGALVALRAAAQVNAACLISVAPPVNRPQFAAISRPSCPWLILQGDADEIVDHRQVSGVRGADTAAPRAANLAGGRSFFSRTTARAARCRAGFRQQGNPVVAELPGYLEEIDNRAQFTKDFRCFSGNARTFLLAGLALKSIFSPVNGLTPSRALVAGRLTTFSFSRPGKVNRPLPRRLFLITPLSDSKTSLTCLRDSSVSLETLPESPT